VNPEIQTWADRLEKVIRRRGITCADRVAVIAETASTQDAALAMSGGRPGLLVLAGRQTGGRGRLGRAWADTEGLGLAATFVLDAREPALLALGAGLAACQAVEEATGGLASVGLKWPNDVVERGGVGRKVAGVLVEQRDGVALLGIGINILQKCEDWPADMQRRAVSLAQLGSRWTRVDVAEVLLAALDRMLRTPAEELAMAWAARDVLLGTRRVFECDGKRVEGVVEAIRPTAFIQVRADDGDLVQLPAMTTSLVKD
jgi:BirA family biotin operon repressor/biotin-[acetyl-CoA-carboxylase] ligase